jgi:hypothetical protein
VSRPATASASPVLRRSLATSTSGRLGWCERHAMPCDGSTCAAECCTSRTRARGEPHQSYPQGSPRRPGAEDITRPAAPPFGATCCAIVRIARMTTSRHAGGNAAEFPTNVNCSTG